MSTFCVDVETTGLNAMFDRILSISVLDVNKESSITFLGENEAEILREFWSIMIDCEYIITFNGDAFDIPFLIKRSIINKVKIRKNLKSIDLRKVTNSFFYSYNKYEKGTLRDWANVLGVNVMTDDGEKMKEYYERNEWDKVKLHGEEDIKITKLLFDRCKECGLI